MTDIYFETNSLNDDHFNDQNVFEIDLKTLKKMHLTKKKNDEIANELKEKFKFEFLKNTNTFSNNVNHSFDDNTSKDFNQIFDDAF